MPGQRIGSVHVAGVAESVARKLVGKNQQFQHAPERLQPVVTPPATSICRWRKRFRNPSSKLLSLLNHCLRSQPASISRQHPSSAWHPYAATLWGLVIMTKPPAAQACFCRQGVLSCSNIPNGSPFGTGLVSRVRPNTKPDPLNCTTCQSVSTVTLPTFMSQ